MSCEKQPQFHVMAPEKVLLDRWVNEVMYSLCNYALLLPPKYPYRFYKWYHSGDTKQSEVTGIL
jgi:hypothetical protein